MISLSDYGTHDESAFPELWEGVVGAWAPSLGPTGLRLHDFSRRQNWGTLTNMDATTDWVVDGGQYALDFDGVDDYVDHGNILNFERTEPFTISAWVRALSFFSFGAIAVKMEPSAVGANFRGYFFGYEIDGLLTFILRSSPIGNRIFVRTQVAVVTLNQWVHACVSYDGTSNSSGVRIYANGVNQSLVVLENNLSGTVITTQPLTFGARPQNNDAYANAQLDDYRIYNRALSPNEISLLASSRGIAYTRRRRASRVIALGPTFQPGWARGSNVLLQPCGVA